MESVRGAVAQSYKHEGVKAASADTQKFLRALEEYTYKGIRKPPARTPPPPMAIRPMTIDDASYVIDSWANSYRRSPATGPIEQGVFNIEQRARIDRLISKTATRVLVACDQQETWRIRGWICFEAPHRTQKLVVVHYVCVQPIYQMFGIGTALVNLARATMADPTEPMWSTHETAPMRHVRPKWNLIFNPYLLEVASRQSAVKTSDLGTEEGFAP